MNFHVKLSLRGSDYLPGSTVTSKTGYTVLLMTKVSFYIVYALSGTFIVVLNAILTVPLKKMRSIRAKIPLPVFYD